MKSLKRIVALVCMVLIVFSCRDQAKSTHLSIETHDIHFTKDGGLTFYSKTDSVLKKIAIEAATNSYEHQTGLMYRKKMKEDRGMLFVFKNERPRPNFYMKNTYIPLDLVYINAAKKIVDFNQNAKALDESLLPSDAPAKYVLEINAGMVKKWGLDIGDKVSFHYDQN